MFLVPVVGVEPTRYRYHRILSPARLPIPSYRQKTLIYYIRKNGVCIVAFLLIRAVFKVRKSQLTVVLCSNTVIAISYTLD